MEQFMFFSSFQQDRYLNLYENIHIVFFNLPMWRMGNDILAMLIASRRSYNNIQILQFSHKILFNIKYFGQLKKYVLVNRKSATFYNVLRLLIFITTKELPIVSEQTSYQIT